jgi:phosphoribosylamine--glycine ligase
MRKFNIPTAKYETFANAPDAINYLKNQILPIVIKADGLAMGKGVLVANSYMDAENFINEIFYTDKFGNARNKVVIEECLVGIEASFIAMIDGNNTLIMATSQDHKRLLDNDKGPNTGGMGAYSPAPIIDKALETRIIKEIIQPVIDGMESLGHKYTGFLYAGLMIDQFGNPKTLEFNCRLGDPETQPIMCRLDSDLSDLFLHGLNGTLNQVEVKWSNQFAIGVILASSGYPDTPQKNDIITGLPQASMLPEIKIFHSSTIIKNNQLLTNGGRVLCLVARAPSLQEAQKKAYNAVKNISFAGMQYRHDIGAKALI